MTPGAAARTWVRRYRGGVLSTISERLAGHPFGSVVPYVLDHDASPVILISRLAEHTRNIGADARVSLLVHDPAADFQAGARLTMVGQATGVDRDHETLKSRYLRYIPDAERLFALGDFALYRVQPRQIRWIGGFGDIRWIAEDDFRPPANRLSEQEPDILEHMNAEHAHTLRDYCRHLHGKTPRDARMAGIDCDGFDVRADGELLRFGFDHPVADADAARAALVALARKARPT
jgi:putative heme iron utilization protein